METLYTFAKPKVYSTGKGTVVKFGMETLWFQNGVPLSLINMRIERIKNNAKKVLCQLEK